MTAAVIDAGDDLPLTIPLLLRERVAVRPDSVFLAVDDGPLTYGEADRRSAELARALLAAGAGAGTRVAILHPNGPDFVVAWLAAARIGAVSVPLSTFSTSTELVGLLRGADVTMLLAASGYRSQDYAAGLRDSIAELTFDGPGPLLSPAVPSLRRIVFAVRGDDERFHAVHDGLDLGGRAHEGLADLQVGLGHLHCGEGGYHLVVRRLDDGRAARHRRPRRGERARSRRGCRDPR